MSGAQAVYHCAAIADLGEADADVMETMRTNVLGATQVAISASEQEVDRLLLASSVYAASNKGGFYRISKQAAESLVKELCSRTAMTYTVLRYGSLYGPNSQEWNGLAKIIRSAMLNGALVYKGSPNARREYIHITDASRLSVDALAPEYAQETLVISGIGSISVRELLATIAEMLDLEVEPRFEVDTTASHYVRTPYAVRREAARKLVPSHFVELEAGLQELIEGMNKDARLD